MDGKQNLYFGGVPTGPEVRKLEAHFDDMEGMRGTLIAHAKIEKVIGVKRKDQRYKSIVDRWRRRVESSTGIVISGRGEAIGKGFVVLSHGEQLSFGVGQRRGAGRKIARWHSTVTDTDEDQLTVEQRKVREHEMLGAARMHTALIEMRRLKIEAPKPTESQPQRESGQLGA